MMSSSLLGGTTCEEGSVQLTNGDSAEYSLVEMCRNSRWAAVCDNDWTMEDMKVVCVQAGNATTGTQMRQHVLMEVYGLHFGQL